MAGNLPTDSRSRSFQGESVGLAWPSSSTTFHVSSKVPSRSYAALDFKRKNEIDPPHTRENVCAAVNQMDALKNQIAAQRGKKISDEATVVLLGFVTNAQQQMLINSGVDSC